MSLSVESDIQASIRAAYPFSVDKFRLAGPDGLTTPWYGLFRSDTCEAIGGGSVTDRYTPHETDDVIALTDAASEAFGGVAEVKCGFDDGHFLIAQPSKAQRMEVFNSDTVWPRLVISAPYGGSGSFRASVSYYRDVCQNLAMMRQVAGAAVVIRHTNSLRRKMDDLIRTFQGLTGAWDNMQRVIQMMENRQVNMVEFLRAVYGEPDRASDRSVNHHRNRTEAIFRRLHSERLRVGRGDLVPGEWQVSAWEAYNAVQGYVQHDSNRRGRPSQIDRIILAASDPAVLRAESLALSV
jgi:hypothetical protein